MDALQIAATENTPAVFFDESTSSLTIEGRSLPEDPSILYNPVIKWFDNNIKKIKDEFIFNFKFEYYNSSTAKYILTILRKLEMYYQSGRKITVNWYYDHDDDDDDILAEGNMYAKSTTVPFNIKEM